MATPEVQAFAAEQFPILHDAIYAVLDVYPTDNLVLDLKAKLDTFYLGAVDILEIQTLAARDGGHKPPPEEPPKEP